MTTEEARYYTASRQARRAWEATQPQLTLSGLDDGPLTADGSRGMTAPSSGKADGGHHRTHDGFTSGDAGTRSEPPALGVANFTTTGADGSPTGNNVRPQNGD